MDRKTIMGITEGILNFIVSNIGKEKTNNSNLKLSLLVHNAKNLYSNYDQYIENSKREGTYNSNEFVIKSEELFDKFNDSIIQIIEYNKNKKIEIKYRNMIKKIEKVYTDWHIYYEENWKYNLQPSDIEREKYGREFIVYITRVVQLLHKIDLY